MYYGLKFALISSLMVVGVAKTRDFVFTTRVIFLSDIFCSRLLSDVYDFCRQAFRWLSAPANFPYRWLCLQPQLFL